MKNIYVCPVCDNSSLTDFTECIDYSVSRESFLLKQCSTCQLLITNPQPQDSELPKYYEFEDYISHTSKGTNIINKLYLIVRRFTLGQKLSLVSKHSSGKKILDVGCGTGSFLSFCKEHGWNVYGVEPSSSARTIALQNNYQVVSTIEECSDQNFDVITLWHVLEHLPDINQSIQKLKSRLAQNGTIFIAVPNYASYDAVHYKQHWAAYDVPRHLWHFRKETIKALLEKHGLSVTTIQPMKFDSYYVSLLSEKYKTNQTNVFGMIKAVWFGLMSNLKAKKKTNYSSLIYIIRK